MPPAGAAARLPRGGLMLVSTLCRSTHDEFIARHVHAMAPQLLRLARRPRKSEVTPISLHETLESIMTLKYAHAGVASRRWLLRRVRCAHAPTAATMRRTTSTATDSEWVPTVLLVRASNK